jgi:cytoskeleton-associated protein 5
LVAHYAEKVYDLLSDSFEDPSATIVYPYVYRILNSSTRVGADAPPMAAANDALGSGSTSPTLAGRSISPRDTASSVASHERRDSSPARSNVTSSSANGHGPAGLPPPTSEPDPDEQLGVILKHISSEKTGALHKEGITELHQFMKAYPHKKARVDKLLESTGPAFRKYITRALASRAAEDQERDAAVSHTLSSPSGILRLRTHPDSRPTELEGATAPSIPASPVVRASMEVPLSPRSPVRTSLEQDDRLSRLHNIFKYRSSGQSPANTESPPPL